MEANPVRVIQYFDGNKQNVIPLFQREYSWEKKNWQTLWDDILVQYEGGADSNHFMGAIVSFPVRTVPVGVNKHLIVDGQQRLTTLAILLCAIRTQLDPKVSARIDDYLINRHYEDQDRLKLVPTQKQGDREAFLALVDNRISDAGSHPMKAAYDFFCSKLRDKDSNDDLLDVTRLLTSIEHSLQVVLINLGDADDPYLIFESLNHKGEPLKQADLVRNYILMKFPHSLYVGGEQEKIYRELWEPMENALKLESSLKKDDLKDKDHLTDYLRHYLMKDGESIKQGGIYTAIKRRMKEMSVASVKEEMSQLRRLSGIYERFVYSDREGRAEVRSRLEMLRDLDVTTCYPLLLRLFDSVDRGAMSETEFQKCLDLLESFVVRRAVCGVPTNSLGRLFLQWTKALPPDGVAGFLWKSMSEGEGNRRWPTDEDFEKSFKESTQYNRKSTRIVLIQLELSFEHKERVDLGNATVEHVMPQSITDQWKVMLGEEYTSIYTKYLDTFGNLTLTAYNSELGNLPFEEKCEELAKSHIELNRWIVDQPTWGEAQIVERATMLAQRAMEIWPRDYEAKAGG